MHHSAISCHPALSCRGRESLLRPASPHYLRSLPFNHLVATWAMLVFKSPLFYVITTSKLKSSGAGNSNTPKRSHKVLSLSEKVCTVCIGKNIVYIGFGTTAVSGSRWGSWTEFPMDNGGYCKCELSNTLFRCLEVLFCLLVKAALSHSTMLKNSFRKLKLFISAWGYSPTDCLFRDHATNHFVLSMGDNLPKQSNQVCSEVTKPSTPCRYCSALWFQTYN